MKRAVGRVGEGVAEFVDGGVEAVPKSTKVFGPEAFRSCRGMTRPGCSKRMVRI
jgi:hypothetical protein